MSTLTVLHAPNHAPSVTRRMLRKAYRMKGVDSIGFTEVYWQIRWIVMHPNWRTTYSVGEDKRRGGKDCPVVVRKKHRNLGEIAIQGCEASTPIKIAPERWINCTMYHKSGFGNVAHIALHPHANIRGVERDNDRVQKFIEQMNKLESLIKLMHSWDFFVVVTGDLNFPPVHDAPHYAPQKVFRRCDMSYWARGVDYVAYSEKLEIKDRKAIPGREIGHGQDHPWMRVELGKKR